MGTSVVASVAEYRGERHFYAADPLARFLIDRLRLTPRRAVALALASVWTVGSLVSIYQGNFLPGPEQPGFLGDFAGLVWRLLIVPAVAGYYIWLATAPAALFDGLRGSDAVHFPLQDLQATYSLYQHRGRTVLALAGAVVVGIVFFTTRGELPGYASEGLTRLASTVGMIIGGYMSAMMAMILVLNVVALRRLLAEADFNLNPLHPDRAGGLGVLGNYALQTAYLMALAGLAIGFVEYRVIVNDAVIAAVYVHLALALYLILATVAFISPLSTAHEGMALAKEALLAEIARQFQHDYRQTRGRLEADSGTLKEEIEKVEQLQALYALTDRFPVWPFDVSTVRRFIAIITTPLLPIAIGILSKIVESRVLD